MKHYFKEFTRTFSQSYRELGLYKTILLFILWILLLPVFALLYAIIGYENAEIIDGILWRKND